MCGSSCGNSEVNLILFLTLSKTQLCFKKNLQDIMLLTKSTAYTCYSRYPLAAAMQYKYSLLLFRLWKEHKAHLTPKQLLKWSS